MAKLCDKKNIILVQTSTHAYLMARRKVFIQKKDIPKPNNVYSGSKYLSEIFVSSICKKYYIIRFPNTIW